MKLEVACEIVDDEFWKATNKYGPFHSPHEGYAIIKEEVDELWDRIKDKGTRKEKVNGFKKEAAQIAAMAIRFMVDMIGDDECQE